MRRYLLLMFFLALGTCFSTNAAFADRHERSGKHHSQNHKPYRAPDEDVNVRFHFSDENRDHARAYLRNTYAHRCPPGLAKRHEGCFPHGYARHYRIGGPLPHNFRPVPYELQTRLRPPARGMYYAMVDDDVLLVTEATHRIVDAITLLSAVR